MHSNRHVSARGEGTKLAESSPNSLSFPRPKKWHDITGGQARELNSRRGVVAGEESRRVPLHFSTPWGKKADKGFYRIDVM